MLTPNYLEQLPQPMIALVNELQEEIIAEVTKRIVKANVLTPSSEWLLYKANQLRLSSAAVNKIIAKSAKLRERTVRELYTEAVKLALNEDAKIYRYAISEGALDPVSSAKLTSYFKSVALNDTFKKGLAATNGLMRNLTNSMAAVSNRMLSDALDLAWLEVASGAFTPDEAVYKAIEKLAEKGLAVVEYKSGHKDQVDVAVRRAVRTGINKTCCDMQLDLANEMGSDLVEVSSHFGARPTHAEWQGQIYCISGKHPKYKPFSVTGYGRGDGLGGWNCRHNFYPFFEKISIPASEPTFTEAENFEYYKKTQKQRGYERAVRRSKRELAALDSARSNTSDAVLKAKLDKEFARKSSMLKKREKRLNDFCRDNGLLKDSSRTRVNGFGRSVSQKAVWGAKHYRPVSAAKSLSIHAQPDSHKNFKADRKIIDSPEYLKKYTGITSSRVKMFDNRVAKCAKDCIYANDGKETERGYILSAKTGRQKGKPFDLGAFGGDFSFNFKDYNKNELIVVHNHPNNAAFSYNDFVLINCNPEIKTIIAAGHDGTVYKLSPKNGKRLDLSDERDYNYYEGKWQRIYAEGNGALSAVEVFAKDLGWEFSYE